MRVSKQKETPVLLEDRVWTLLHRMGFEWLSADGGARLVLEPRVIGGATNQIDVVGIDSEVAVAVECKSAESERRDPRVQEYLAKLAALREPFARAVHSQFPGGKRRVLSVLVLSNIVPSEPDERRSADLRIPMLLSSDLEYYEALGSQLGPASRFQFLSDMLEGKEIPGLEMAVPSIRLNMGGRECFLFAASPEYLLKMCYVSHRARGSASDIDTYQRMVSRSRLRAVRNYISEEGIFPTNIVLSFKDQSHLRFERAEDLREGPAQGVYGWLHLSPPYKSAWVIDGQHRLFAYSGHERAPSSLLPVLAFVGLHPSEQAKLFIDINAEQRKVKRSLLQELFAELHWASPDPLDRIAAIVSRAIQQLDDDLDSPFYHRILKADETKGFTRCISLTTLFKALDKPGFFYQKVKSGSVHTYGPLWSPDPERALRRLKTVLNGWFKLIVSKTTEWWSLGSGPGGGLAMNDGVTVCVNTLRSSLVWLDSKVGGLADVGDADLVSRLEPYGTALATYLGGLTPDQRSQFRALRGGQGQATGTFQAERAMKQLVPEFSPEGLDDFLRREEARTTERARKLIEQIEKGLQLVVLSELKEEYPDKDQWWFEGVPHNVRTKVSGRIEEEKGRHGGREDYLDLIDYRAIALNNWELFKDILAHGDAGNKLQRTEWIVKVNEVRNVAFHPSHTTPVAFEDVSRLEEYWTWFSGKATTRA